MNINFTKFVPISEFVPYIRTAIDGIDEDMALVYIANAIIEFCKDSRILKYTQCIELQPCVDSYILDVPFGRVSEIISVTAQTLGCYARDVSIANSVYVDGNVLYIDDMPATGAMQDVTITVSLVPRRDSTDVPEVLYEDWVMAVAHAALSSLYLLTDAKWYNPNAAQTNSALYRQFLSRARVKSITAHKPLQPKLQPRHRSRR